MSPDQLTLLATVAVAAAAYLAVPRFRLQSWILGRSAGAAPPTGALHRLLSLLAPDEGAPSSFIRLAGAVTVGCVLLPLTGSSPLPPLATLSIAGVGIFVGLGRWSPPDVRSRGRATQAALPGVCTLLAVCLEAGLPLRNAVTAVAEAAHEPIAGLLRRLDTSVRLGVPEVDAWRELGEAQPAFAALARELGHAAGSGMALAPVLRQHAREAQRAAHGAAEAQARKAGVSSVVPLMACFLPAFILIGVVPIVGGVATRLFQ